MASEPAWLRSAAAKYWPDAEQKEELFYRLKLRKPPAGGFFSGKST